MTLRDRATSCGTRSGGSERHRSACPTGTRQHDKRNPVSRLSTVHCPTANGFRVCRRQRRAIRTSPASRPSPSAAARSKPSRVIVKSGGGKKLAKASLSFFDVTISLSCPWRTEKHEKTQRTRSRSSGPSQARCLVPGPKPHRGFALVGSNASVQRQDFTLEVVLRQPNRNETKLEHISSHVQLANGNTLAVG